MKCGLHCFSQSVNLDIHFTYNYVRDFIFSFYSVEIIIVSFPDFGLFRSIVIGVDCICIDGNDLCEWISDDDIGCLFIDIVRAFVAFVDDAIAVDGG